MFPIAKLERLPVKTALKKIALMLQALERELTQRIGINTDEKTKEYLSALFRFLKKTPLSESLDTLLGDETRLLASGAPLLRTTNRVRHAILAFLGAEPAEWDFLDKETGALAAASRTVFPLRVYLEEIRSPFNVGSILRSAEAFGVAHVFLSDTVPLPTHPRAARTARGAEKTVPWSRAVLPEMKAFGPVFALETGGVDIDTFSFPKSGTVLIGSEELGLSPEALDLARAGLGRVSIPLAGAKRSLNVAVAFGILMQKWFSFLAGPSGTERPARRET